MKTTQISCAVALAFLVLPGLASTQAPVSAKPYLACKVPIV